MACRRRCSVGGDFRETRCVPVDICAIAFGRILTSVASGNGSLFCSCTTIGFWFAMVYAVYGSGPRCLWVTGNTFEDFWLFGLLICFEKFSRVVRFNCNQSERIANIQILRPGVLVQKDPNTSPWVFQSYGI